MIRCATSNLVRLGSLKNAPYERVARAADGIAKPFAETVTESAAVDHGLAHVFERRSVVPQHKILEAALVERLWPVGPGTAKGGTAGTILTSSASVRSFRHGRFSTKELSLIRTVNAGIDAVKPIAHRYEPPDRLGPDQRKALAHILTSPDRFTGFRGLAGSGKSTALVELATALCHVGLRRHFLRPDRFRCRHASQRVSYLGKTMTLQKLLADRQRCIASFHRVRWWCWMKPGPWVWMTWPSCLKSSAAMVVGWFCPATPASIRPLPRGDALRIIEQYSSYRFSELTTIRRQKPAAFREIVELAAAKQTDKAFAKLR